MHAARCRGAGSNEKLCSGRKIERDVSVMAERVSKKFHDLDSIEDTIGRLRTRLKEGMQDESKIPPPFVTAEDEIATHEKTLAPELLEAKCNICHQTFPNTYIKEHRRVCLERRKVPPSRISRGKPVSLPDPIANPGLLDERLATPAPVGGTVSEVLRAGRILSQGLPDDRIQPSQASSSTPKPRGTAVAFALQDNSVRAAAPGAAARARATVETHSLRRRARASSDGSSDASSGRLTPSSGEEEVKGNEHGAGVAAAGAAGADELDFFLKPPGSRNTKSRRRFHRSKERPDSGWTRRSSIASHESDGSAISIEGIASFLQLDWDGARGLAKDRVVEGLNTLFSKHYDSSSLGTLRLHTPTAVHCVHFISVVPCSAVLAKRDPANPKQEPEAPQLTPRLQRRHSFMVPQV